ncbi:MAG: nucleoid-associated protein [Bacteroides sp.]
MIINKAILHILDFNSDVCVLSQKELDFSNNDINTYLEKHLRHTQMDVNQKSEEFLPNSSFFRQLNKYLMQQSNFIEFSSFIGNKLYDNIFRSDKLDSVDLLVVDFSENNVKYFALILLTSKIAYTHQVLNNDGEIHNEIIRHYAILPNTNQKLDSYAFIRCDNFTVGFNDKKRMIDGNDTYLLPDRLLQCTSSISSKEAIKTINQIATEIAEKHGVNSAMVLSKAKNYLLENAEISSSFSPTELGQDVFAASEEMQKDFEVQISKAQLPPDVRVEKTFAIRTGKNHKIKTDTGIEIIFPAEYFESHDFIEFINNSDGTLSIELKNIGKIINK